MAVRLKKATGPATRAENRCPARRRSSPADRRDVVDHRLVAEPLLDDGVLTRRVLVERDEQQSLIERAGGVDATVVAVAGPGPGPPGWG